MIVCAIALGAQEMVARRKPRRAFNPGCTIQGMIVVVNDAHFGRIAVRPATEGSTGREMVMASSQ